MSLTELSVAATVELLLYVSRRITESKDLLTQADKMGDADHGIGMAKGFDAVRHRLTQGCAEDRYGDLQQLFTSVGNTLLSTIGGAAGPIFGSFFRGAATGLKGRPALESRGLAEALAGGLDAVMKIGKARPGDKTMLDALEPAARKAGEVKGEPLDRALAAIAAAAESGRDQTERMVARAGKARTLGERTLGHPDPGAVSMHLILKYMAEYTAGLSEAGDPE